MSTICLACKRRRIAPATDARDACPFAGGSQLMLRMRAICLARLPVARDGGHC